MSGPPVEPDAVLVLPSLGVVAVAGVVVEGKGSIVHWPSFQVKMLI